MTDVVIIGGGTAGLSAGIYARMAGLSAAIYEAGSTPGGNLCGWERGGFYVDNCIHWLTGTNPAADSYRMWEELGVLGGVEIIQNETLYTCEYRGERLSLSCDLERLRRDMLSLSPEDAKETERFIRAVRLAQGASGVAGKGHDRGVTPSLLLRSAPAAIRCWRMTAGELAARFRHPLIREFLAGLLTERFGALALLVVFATFTGQNGGLPRGGSRAAASRMAERFVSLGGRLYVGKKAVKLERRAEKIFSARFADGTEAEGGSFVVTADPARVFGSMVDLPMPRKLAKMYSDPRLFRFSSVQCAFACEGTDLPFRGDFIFELGSDGAALGARRLVLREFSHEPEFSPEGKSLIETMTFIDEEASLMHISRSADREKYAESKRRIARDTLGAIVSRFPGLDGRLTPLDVWTPATYRRFTGSEAGTYMSFAFTKKYLPVMKKCRVPGTENLYLAGQWLQPPGGLPIAAKSGRRAIEEIIEYDF
ncbi:MAG: NAD(P)/FAD-dependent oxidoreductase [Clostridia bacterium]|nr:NAD(P)/FAD-dependent oxidoreductase [Clostridia bacterium]